MSRHKVIAGWAAFLAAMALALMSAIGRLLNRPGDHFEVVGLATAFLAYSAACFGMKTYEVAVQARQKLNAVTDAPPST